MNSVEKLYRSSTSAGAFAKGYFSHLAEVFARVDAQQIEKFINVLWDARERDATVFFIGNGGSAATASHFANDISIGTRPTGKPFRAVSLTDNVAVLTAIGNDYGYTDIFLRQLQTQLKPGDVVVAISASGNSPNLLNAIEYANKSDAITVGLTGFDGGKLLGLVQLAVHVPTDKGEYGPVEDVHMVLDHLTHAFLAYRSKS